MKRRLRGNTVRAIINIGVVVIPIFSALWVYQLLVPSASAAVAPLSTSGVMFYGDTTNVGVMKASTFTSPVTLNAEFSGIAGSASNLMHVIAKTALTREEIMIGSLRVNGTLQIESCTNACDANGDFTNRWSHASTSTTQDCDSAPTLGTCYQAFDIGYQALNGKAMVVYAGDGADGGTVTDTDTVYYAEWDGSAWAPNTTPGTPGTSNDIDLGGAGASAGTPEWIRYIPSGDNLADDRSNRGMLLVSDSNDDLWSCYWNGSSWTCDTSALVTDLENCDRARCFDGNWQGYLTFILTHTDADATNDVKYQKYVVGSGWTVGETQAYTTSASTSWIISAADPTSSRIYSLNGTSGNDTRGAVWRADDATDGWTVCGSGDCPDTTTESAGGSQSGIAFERFNGEALHVYNDAAQNATQGNKGITYTPTSTWSTGTLSGITPTDDHQSTKAWGSPNSDDIMIAAVDVDCDVDAVLYNGSTFETAISNFELLLSSSNGSCANATPVQGMMLLGYDFAWKIYTPWQRNWRWFPGTDTASTPSTGTALAAENTAPTGIVNGQDLRLRMSYVERGRSISNTDARKKLQYTSGCNPNTTLETDCTWTDVDDAGGAGNWRYLADGDIACTATDCDDGTTLVGTVLTGTSTCSAGLGCGTWVEDKDAAAGANMDHTSQSGADTVQESEYIIEPNGASPGATYYFRIYNNDQETPIYREQDANDCGGGAAQCTYPSLSLLGTDQLRYRWRSDDGNETTGSSLINEDTAHTTMIKNNNYRLRYLINVTGGSATSYDYRLEYAARNGATCDTDETYTTVPDTPTTEHFDMVLTAHYADGDASTNAASGPGVLSNPSGTFTAGKLIESTSNSTGALTLTDGQYTEIEYAFQANSNALDSQNYCFRVTNTGTALTTYTVYAAAITQAASGPTTDQILRGGNWFNGGAEQSFFWASVILPSTSSLFDRFKKFLRSKNK